MPSTTTACACSAPQRWRPARRIASTCARENISLLDPLDATHNSLLATVDKQEFLGAFTLVTLNPLHSGMPALVAQFSSNYLAGRPIEVGSQGAHRFAQRVPSPHAGGGVTVSAAVFPAQSPSLSSRFNASGWLLVLAALVLVVFLLLPMGALLSHSVVDDAGQLKLQRFRDVLTAPGMADAAWNTL